MGARHITETQIFTELVGKRVETNALCFIHGKPEYVGFPPPPTNIVLISSFQI